MSDLPAVVIQTVGAVTVACITGIVTYLVATSPLKAQVEQLKTTQSSPGSDEGLLKELYEARSQLKEAKSVVAELKKPQEGAWKQAQLEALKSERYSTDELSQKNCVSRIESAAKKRDASLDFEGEDYGRFRTEKYLYHIFCGTGKDGVGIVIGISPTGDTAYKMVFDMQQLLKEVFPNN